MDRRISVVAGLKEHEVLSIQTLSDLANYQKIVLLGEPGIGKTTALTFMADQEEAGIMNVRALMNGFPHIPNTTLFLDALDEYRSDGGQKDKIYTLARLIHEKSPDRWRLTCRAEDWRNQADTQPLEMGASQQIVVAQLLPLDYDEACAVLNTLGEANPEDFMSQAEALGAHAFTESPLSLKLLHKAVRNKGNWPATRFDLFSAAIQRLAHEHNQAYQADYERNSPDAIIGAIGKIALLQLLSGARTIWRSQGPTPDDADKRAFITYHDFNLENTLLQDALDTALFRGEGESFEFMHRMIAEFLAGKTLATAVTAKCTNARLPLRRALALITGNDSKPPTELRGVFAWLAAHLAHQLDNAGALKMAEIDACSVLTYGDVAAFNTNTRRVILHNLDRDDPYFLATARGVTVLGGLLDETLIDDIIKILQKPPEESHLLLTVAESLTSGQPIPALQPHLKQFVLNPAHNDWQRKRILDAFIHGSQNSIADLRALFDELANETASIEREELRIAIAEKLHPEHLAVIELQALLADFERTPESNTVGRLMSLQHALEKNPCPALFDSSCAIWRPSSASSNFHRLEVDQLLDAVLARCILSDQKLDGTKLWRWVANSRQYIWINNYQDNKTRAAIAQWLEVSHHREADLFETILFSLNKETDMRDAAQIYSELCGRWPSDRTLQTLLGRVKTGDAENIARPLLAIFVEKARKTKSEPALFWDIYELLEKRPEFASLLPRLTTTDVEYGKPSDYWDQKRKAEHKKIQTEKIEKLQTLIPELSTGKHLEILMKAARLYFQRTDDRNPSLHGFERVVADTNQGIAEAISLGWQYWTKTGIQEFDIAKLGGANQTIYFAEYAAIAGLALLIEKHAQANIPKPAITSLTLSVLRCSLSVSNVDIREKLEDWVTIQLTKQPKQGVELLHTFWKIALERESPSLYGMNALTRQPSAAEVLSDALTYLLSGHRNLSAETLHTMLLAANKILSKEQIKELCCAALENESITDDVRQLWQLLQFLNSPTDYQPPLLGVTDAKQVNDILNQLDQFERTRSDNPTETRIAITRFIIELAGPLCSPGIHDFHDMSYKVRCAIDRFSSYTDFEAATALKTLIESPKLHAWHASLRHALSQQTRKLSDLNFSHPTPLTIHAALAGGPPINAADLFAIAIEELRRLQKELHTTNTTDWKHYWNRNKNGKVTEPLVENECRNYLLTRLKDRCIPYQISAVIPEAQSAEGTRVDILMLSGAGASLPIEAKRHYHENVWSAASGQLQGYATAAGAEGFGIYLVFWFGDDYQKTPKTPKTPDQSAKPNSAEQMETMLVKDLSEKLRPFTEVIVFDVSRKTGAIH